MQGVIQKVEFSKTGNKKVQIDGKWYSVGRLAFDAAVGNKIDFEWEEFGEDRGNGRPKGLKSWKPIVNGAGKPETGSTISDADILRSVSNVVGSACAAGTIKDATELEKWFVAAWAGFTRRQKSANGADPDFDDDLPPSAYEGLDNSHMQRSNSADRF